LVRFIAGDADLPARRLDAETDLRVPADADLPAPDADFFAAEPLLRADEPLFLADDPDERVAPAPLFFVARDLAAPELLLPAPPLASNALRSGDARSDFA
jgi:hypothetical protein